MLAASFDATVHDWLGLVVAEGISVLKMGRG